MTLTRHAASCKRKIGYVTQAEARQQIRLLKKRTPVSTRVSVYLCTACGLWHIGSRRKELQKPRRVG